MFFFEKKNQKTFFSLAPRPNPNSRRKRMKSLFASFSSEKEGLPSLPLFGSAPMPYHRHATGELRP
jgi:hypothetical protein